MFHQSTFSNSKTVFFLLCLLVLAGITGCRKDSANGSPLNPSSSAMATDRSELPGVVHGMLHFDSFEKMKAFTEMLRLKEEDNSQVNSAYTSLGIDASAESMPNLTDYPVCLTTEMAISGFTSARKAEETVINNALDQGSDLTNSVVVFPYWKTALNADRAVHVGNRIYKYFDNGGVAIVLNNDWALYDAIQSVPFSALSERFNLIVTGDAHDDWDEYFAVDAYGGIDPEALIFKPRFSTQLTDGYYSVNNVSQVESTAGSATFTWYYADNTSSTGPNPDRKIGASETVTVVINNGSGTSVTYTAASILACSVENFTITNLSNNQIRFELPGYVPGDPANTYNLRWVFSDGTTSTANPVIKTFSSNGTATCQMLHKNSGEVACQFSKPYAIKCGEKKSKSQTHIFNNAGGSGQKWKLDCSIWVQSGEVGCRSKYLRRIGFAWVPWNNQGACADISGKYKREIFNPNKTCIDVNASGSKCLGNGTFPTSVAFTIPEVTNVFREPNMLSSGHRIKVNGVWMGPGTGSMPRLFLD